MMGSNPVWRTRERRFRFATRPLDRGPAPRSTITVMALAGRAPAESTESAE
jgi:hypothetical protein